MYLINVTMPAIKNPTTTSIATGESSNCASSIPAGGVMSFLSSAGLLLKEGGFHTPAHTAV